MISAPRAAATTQPCFRFIDRVIRTWNPRTPDPQTPLHLNQQHRTHLQVPAAASAAAPRAMAAAPAAAPPAPACPAPHTIDSDFLCPQPSTEGRPITCLLVLNFQLPKATAKLWHQASFRICADGGSNRLYDGLPSMLGLSEVEAQEMRPTFLPQAIIGDLDSIRPDVRQFYLGHGVPVLDQSADQDTTDLMKCLDYLQHHVLSRTGTTGTTAPQQQAVQPPQAAPAAAAALPDHRIIVLGALGGRLDHALSNLNTLYQYPQLDIVLWGDGNLVRLVKPGTTHIRPDREREGPACGLVPLGGPAIVTSSGLHWDLDNTLMQISGLISTCNVMEADVITVTTDRELLWMTEVEEGK